MAKSTVPGNYAVAGISGTSTSKPTTSLTSGTASGTTSGKTTTATSSSNKTSSSGTTSTRSSSSSGSSGSSGSAKSSTSSSSGTSSGTASTADTTPSYSASFYAALANGITSSGNVAEELAANKATAATSNLVKTAKANTSYNNVAPINYVDIAQQVSNLKTQEAKDKAQAASTIDYATSKAITDLNRTLEDSKATYQTQRNQVDADEAKALDNQALYAEARGDKGGIGQAQYGAIQNTAANNRLSVNAAEAKLQTDTARQIADLQAQGEYEKADKIAEISKTYLSELNDLEQWAKEQNVDVEQFNAKLSEWQNEYALDVSKYLTDTELDAAKLSGYFSNGATTADYRTDTNDRYASAAKAMISAGIVPSDEQLEAMGWTPEQYWIYKMAQSSAT